MTPAPLTVELWRGPHLESRHVVHAVVADPAGTVVRVWGDAGRLTHPRSAVKPIQALPLVESGAADAFGVDDVELALACASHNGEPGHVEAVEAWLARIGRTPDDLECGVEVGKGPTPTTNNCSGKHAGFLTLARHLGVPPAGYTRADHPVQQLVSQALADVAEVALDVADAGIDGCGIPVHPLPLRALAGAGARFGAPPSHWAPERVDAARRLAAAMAAHPWHVAGTGRLCTELVAAAGGEVLVKVGAEGVQLAALPSQGLGVAVKAEDGATRASEVALGHVLAALGCDAAPIAEVFERRSRISNWAGTHVADLQVVDPTP
ncbi:MAG TPA: asparaginase [Acidimicrobiales bacterium]|nr:asparaginase [Acidimicrobiales bacterium]